MSTPPTAEDLASFRRAVNLRVSLPPSIGARLLDEIDRQRADVDGPRKALVALAAERNTWARQMADLRDELDTARQERDDAIKRAGDASNERDLLAIRLEELAP